MRAYPFSPTVSIGSGAGGSERKASSNRGFTKAIFFACSIYLISTSLSKGRKTELANDTRKADTKPQLCPSPTCCCSKMGILLAACNSLRDNSRIVTVRSTEHSLSTCSQCCAVVSIQRLYTQIVFLTSSDIARTKRRTAHSVFLNLRQVHVLNIVIWKDGRALTLILGRLLFEIMYKRCVFEVLRDGSAVGQVVW